MSRGYDLIRFKNDHDMKNYHNKKGRRKIISTHVTGTHDGKPMWLLVVRERWWKRWFGWIYS